MTIEKVTEFIITLMAIDMKAFGKMIESMERVQIIIPIVPYNIVFMKMD